MNASKTAFLMSDELPHIIINGDNIDVIRDLHDKYDGQVELIYIDPPYNRGDVYSFYSDAKSHDDWLSEMETVLLELKPLLKNEGSLWISIDDSEMPYLKVKADQVFGRENGVATIVWQKRNTRENRKIFSNNHEYILVYVINKKAFKKKRHLLPASEDMLKRFKNPDNDSRGPWQSVTLNVQAGHAVASQFYTIVSPTGVKHDPPPGRCWIYNEERMLNEIKANNIWFGEDGSNAPRLKKFLKDSNVGVVPETLWLSDFAGTNKDAKNELKQLGIYDKAIFETPKPEKLLEKIIMIATDKDDIVFDCFLGSGTTTAVAHKLGRSYIGIDCNESVIKYDKERMKRVVKGDKIGISTEIGWDGGGDFDICVWR